MRKRITHSIARFWTASAPNRPCPMKVSGGLWYTDAKVDISPSNCSNSPEGSACMVVVIGGLSERTIFCNSKYFSVFSMLKIDVPSQFEGRLIIGANKHTRGLVNLRYHTPEWHIEALSEPAPVHFLAFLRIASP